MPVQVWVLPPRYFQPGDKAIYLPDINCTDAGDDLYVSVAGCDEGDGQLDVVVTDGNNPAGPPISSATLKFTKSDDGMLRQASGVVRVVIQPPSVPCWITAKVQKKAG